MAEFSSPSPFHADTLLVLYRVGIELERARRLHEPWHSPHEGWAVIKEEHDELWKLIMEDAGTTPHAMEEAIQLAATGARYVLDLCPELLQGSVQAYEPAEPEPEPELNPRAPHEFQGVVAGTFDRPCTLCGLADRHPIHRVPEALRV